MNEGCKSDGIKGIIAGVNEPKEFPHYFAENFSK